MTCKIFKVKEMIFLNKISLLKSFLILTLITITACNDEQTDISELGTTYNPKRMKDNIPLVENEWILNDLGALWEFRSAREQTCGHVSKLINNNKFTGYEWDFYQIDSILLLSLYERRKEKSLFK